MENEILFSRRERNGAFYAEIILNRPEKGNALTMPMLERLKSLAQELANDRTVRLVVIRGAGRFFCTGGDIKAWGALSPRQMSQEWILPGIAVLDIISALPQPVISAIHGHAIGGGLELALASDLRLGMKGAKFGTPEVAIGMIAGWTGVRKLAETIGFARAQHLTLLGHLINAEQALQWGLITELADSPEAFELSLNVWIDRLLANSPIAMSLTKSLLASGRTDSRQQHADAAELAAASADCTEGVRAFSEKRPPVFQKSLTP